MTIDYSIAGEFADLVHAIFIVESNEDPAAVGDGGRALGLGQHHPAFFAEYYHTGPHFPASVGDTWVEAWIKATATFFDVWDHLGMDKMIQAYNLGVDAVLKGGRNPDYLQRFDAALNKIRALKAAAKP